MALFSSLYFPARLNGQAQEALELRAGALGALASAELAPTLRLISDGLSQPEELDNVLAGMSGGQRGKGEKGEVDLSGTDVEFIAVLKAVGSASVRPSGENVVRKAVRRGEGGQAAGLPSLEFAVPRAAGQPCVMDNGELLTVRCFIKDQDAEGLLVAAFRKDALLAAQQQNLQVGLLSGIGAATIGLILALVFGRALAAPMALVSQAAREVASGDVTVNSVSVQGAGEVRSMALSFNEMLTNLRNLVGQMVSLTGRLNGASQGLISASKDQEHVTSQQASYAQEIAATFEELSRTAEQISQSTDVVEEAARNTSEAVEQAKAVVAQVMGGIRDVRNESKEVADAITKLNADVQQVSKIAQVINQVAERSDLLALNAALEGTKAGEVGRGFSLVAAEMRKLAENVSASARDIGRIVEKVQESGSAAVNKARVGVAASDRGVEVAEQASDVFERMAELARHASQAAQQIAVATRQQRQSSEQAVQGARNVADLVKQGVDATARSNKIAQDLQGVAQALTAVTNRFKVGDAPQAMS